jgi:hypothetical protein
MKACSFQHLPAVAGTGLIGMIDITWRDIHARPVHRSGSWAPEQRKGR